MFYKATLVLIFASVFSNAQIRFEKGFIIDNSDQKIECMIRNVDWQNNPSEIEYKLSDNAKVSIGNLKNIKGFEIQNGNSYLRADVKIDRSSTDTNKLSNTKEPSFNNEQLFLKKIVSGDASLYQYTDGNLFRFFYQMKDQPQIDQLVYKVYEVEPEYIVVHNNEYINQLVDHLKCTSISDSQIENTVYQVGSLKKLFVKYNQCINPTAEVQEEKKNTGMLHLNLRPSLNFSSFSASNAHLFVDSSTYLFAPFDSGNVGTNMGFGIGVELEYVMGFNKNK